MNLATEKQAMTQRERIPGHHRLGELSRKTAVDLAKIRRRMQAVRAALP